MPSKEELVRELSKKKKSELIRLLDAPKSSAKKELVKELSKKKKSELLKLLEQPSRKDSKLWLISGSVLLAVLLVIGFSMQGKEEGTTLIYLTDKNCGDCYNVSINGPVLRQYGLNPVVKEYDINSPEGKYLISKYSIKRIPTFIVLGVNDSYEKLLAVWHTVGTIENDSALVFRKPERISYKFKVLNSSGEFIMFVPPVEVLGGFVDTGEELCTENGKPLVYFFGSTSCPHSRWEHPIIENISSQFNTTIVFKDNMDTNNDKNVYIHYLDINRGAVPFTVIGCRFVRLGSGESSILLNTTLAKLMKTHSSEVLNALSMYKSGNWTMREASRAIDKLVLRDLLCNVTNAC